MATENQTKIRCVKIFLLHFFARVLNNQVRVIRYSGSNKLISRFRRVESHRTQTGIRGIHGYKANKQAEMVSLGRLSFVYLCPVKMMQNNTKRLNI